MSPPPDYPRPQGEQAEHDDHQADPTTEEPVVPGVKRSECLSSPEYEYHTERFQTNNSPY